MPPDGMFAVMMLSPRQLIVPLGISANLHVAVEALLVGDLSGRCDSLLSIVSVFLRSSGCILCMLLISQAIDCFLVLLLESAHCDVALYGHRLRDVGLMFVVGLLRKRHSLLKNLIIVILILLLCITRVDRPFPFGIVNNISRWTVVVILLRIVVASVHQAQKVVIHLAHILSIFILVQFPTLNLHQVRHV